MLSSLLIALPALAIVWQLFGQSNRTVGLYALMLYSTFLGDFVRLPSGVSVAMVLGGFILLVGIIQAIRKRTAIPKPNPLDFLSGTLLLWVANGILMQGGSLAELRGPAVVAGILLTTKLGRQVLPNGFTRLVRAVAAGGIVLAIVCVAQGRFGTAMYGMSELPAAPGDDTPVRVLGFWQNPNMAAFYLLIGFCAMLQLYRVTRTAIIKPVLLCGAGFVAYAILLTESRAAFIAAILALALWLTMSMRLGVRTALTLAVGAPLAVVGTSLREIVEAQVFPNRPQFIETGRIERWAIGLRAVTDSPLFGDRSLTYDFSAVFYHNDVLQLAADYGVLAGGIFASMLTFVFYSSFRHIRAGDSSRIGEFVLLLLLAGTAMSWFHGLLLSGICFWTLVGLGVNYMIEAEASLRPSAGRPARILAANTR